MRARQILLGAFALYLLIGPIGKQVFGVKLPRSFQTWQMFVGTASDTCQVRFTEVGNGGAREVIDARPKRLAGQRWRVKRAHINAIARRVCNQAIGSAGREVDVRLEARCGSRRRWATVDSGATNVCAKRI